MGVLRRIGIGLSALGAQVGLVPAPQEDPERLARIEHLYEGYRQEFPDVPAMDVAELQELLLQGDVIIVDVRTDAERAVSMLPGAVAKDQFDAEATAGKTVVAYCTIGYRSGLWVAEVREQGVSAVNLRGSVLAWTHAGGALHGPSGDTTHRVHTYGRLWDLARSDYEAVF